MTSNSLHWLRACEGKHHYQSKAEARQEKHKRLRQLGVMYAVYRCHCGQGYCLAHSKKRMK